MRVGEFDPILFGLGVGPLIECVGVQPIQLLLGEITAPAVSNVFHRATADVASSRVGGNFPRVGFTKEELESYRGMTVPDLIGDGCRLLFVGINPGLWTAATQTHFCHPSNRFYPALRRAGLIDFEVEADIGLSEEQREMFVKSGMGISNLVARATVRASELTAGELRSGGARLRRLVADVRPPVVAVAGITAYRTAFGERGAVAGLQATEDGTEWWVVPNPSGLNAHVTANGLADWFAQLAKRAGIS